MDGKAKLIKRIWKHSIATDLNKMERISKCYPCLREVELIFDHLYTKMYYVGNVSINISNKSCQH